MPSNDDTACDIRVHADADDLSRRLAESVTVTIDLAVRERGWCGLVLSGGRTPRELYRLLAVECGDRIPWPHVHVFWGDERYVSPDSHASNYRMAKEELLDHVPCPGTNVHPMRVALPSPESAARAYEQVLRGYFAGEWPTFDLLLLGLGEDGHTASIFPGSAALRESTRWVIPSTAPVGPSRRMTLTLPALTAAARIDVMVAGGAKAAALAHVLGDSPDPDAYPAAGLRSTRGRLVWWVDREAASQLAR